MPMSSMNNRCSSPCANKRPTTYYSFLFKPTTGLSAVVPSFFKFLFSFVFHFFHLLCLLPTSISSFLYSSLLLFLSLSFFAFFLRPAICSKPSPSMYVRVPACA